jgi:hypothetical protein
VMIALLTCGSGPAGNAERAAAGNSKADKRMRAPSQDWRSIGKPGSAGQHASRLTD